MQLELLLFIGVLVPLLLWFFWKRTVCKLFLFDNNSLQNNAVAVRRPSLGVEELRNRRLEKLTTTSPVCKFLCFSMSLMLKLFSKGFTYWTGSTRSSEEECSLLWKIWRATRFSPFNATSYITNSYEARKKFTHNVIWLAPKERPRTGTRTPCPV